MPSRIALHPGHPWVKPCASKSDCFRYTRFDGPASAGGLGRRASSGSWLRSRRSPNGRTAAACLCPGRSHGQTGMLTISLRVGPPFWHRSPSDCPSRDCFAVRNQDVLTGLHPETDEYTRFHPVFCFRSIRQRTHSIPHSFSEHASAHVVSATSPPFEWYFPIRSNCVQVQQGGGVHNHPSSGLRFWWYLHLTVELKLVLECPDHTTHQSHCSLG